MSKSKGTSFVEETPAHRGPILETQLSESIGAICDERQQMLFCEAADVAVDRAVGVRDRANPSLLLDPMFPQKRLHRARTRFGLLLVLVII